MFGAKSPRLSSNTEEGNVAIGRVPAPGKQENESAKAHVAFVTRGTLAITCQLWGTVCPVCLSLERESTEGGSRPDVGAEG